MFTRFRDRRDAGRQLAQALRERGYQGDKLIVLGIPRGGVPVADEVATALEAPLDVVIARKLRAPYQPELAIGAVVSGDHLQIVNEELARETGATPEYLEAEIRHQQKEIERRWRAYHGECAGAAASAARAPRPAPEVEGKTVLVVDDGIATGYTFRAALAGLRRRRPERLVAAVPVAPPESLPAVRELADDVVCLQAPELFLAVGVWYEDFSQTTDDEVVEILQRAGAGRELEVAGRHASSVGGGRP